MEVGAKNWDKWKALLLQVSCVSFLLNLDAYFVCDLTAFLQAYDRQKSYVPDISQHHIVKNIHPGHILLKVLD